jgi:ABC-type multidrug transport system permease subunit
VINIKLYKLIAVIFFIIRQFYIPNPFDALGDGYTLYVNQIPFIIPPLLLNMMAEPIIQVITYNIVGFYYRRGSNPFLGSVLYMIFYCIHIFILWILSLVRFNIGISIIAIVVYFMIHIICLILLNRLCQ